MRIFFGLLIALMLMVPASSMAGWSDVLKKAAPVVEELSGDSSGGSSLGANLATEEIIKGLKEALVKAVGNSTTLLSKADGYLKNPKVTIPMPDSLQTLEQAARMVGQDKLADEFITSINRAAERAAGETVDVFGNAITSMSFEDARGILNGGDTAATEFFQRTSTADLAERIMPIVKQATNAVGVTRKYKELTGNVTALGAAAGYDITELDKYVTDKAVAGLFVIMAEEEKKIRTDPVARTTDLLKKVFGQ